MFSHEIEKDFIRVTVDADENTFKEAVLDPLEITLDQYKSIQNNLQAFQNKMELDALDYMLKNKPATGVTGYEISLKTPNDYFVVIGTGNKTDVSKDTSFHVKQNRTIDKDERQVYLSQKEKLITEIFTDVNN